MNNIKVSFKELIIFSLPIILGQLSQMLIGAGDMAIASRHSNEALSAIGIAVAFSNPIFVCGMGFMVALSPVIAKKRGEGKSSEELLFSVIVFGLLLSIPYGLASYLTHFLVPLFGYDPSITLMVESYLKITAISFPGVFLFLSLKEFFQAEEKVLLPNIISMIAVLLNLVLNYILVFGNELIPSMGVDGLAWASFLVRTFLGLSLVIFIFKRLKKTQKTVDISLLKEVLILGFPMSIAFFFEVMAFCMVSLLVGQLGIVESAANNIILTLASISFMIPLAISSAVSVKVGHAFGEKNESKIRSFAWASLIASLGYMSMSALFMTFFPEILLMPFSPSPEVSLICVQSLVIVAMFQIFDGAQVTLTGILRGIGISRITSITTFIGYWVIGIPCGYFFAHYLNLRVRGFWGGQALALTIVAIILFIKLKLEFRKHERIS